MIFSAKKQGSTINILGQIVDYLKSMPAGDYTIEIKQVRNVRTISQNNALHLYFEMLAEALSGAGYDVKKTLRYDIEIPWTKELIKELLWRPIQKALFKKDSTTQLLKLKEIDQIYEIINREIGGRTGVYVPFPSYGETQEKIS